jgi:type I restriction enzyme S subunit
LFGQWLKSRISGTSQKYVPLWLLRDLPVPAVPDAEQFAILSILQACDKKIEAMQRELACLEELFRVMLEGLTSGQISAVPLIEEHQAR